MRLVPTTASLGLVTLALLGSGTTASAHAQPLGGFSGHADIGAVGTRGTATYDTLRQTFSVSGSGRNVWGTADEMHLVWKRMTGDFILSTRARFVGAGGDPHRKIGWTARASLAPSAAHVSAALHGDGLAALQFRRAAGAETEESRSPVTGADVVVLERRGSRWIMSVAKHGDTLVTTEVAEVALPDTVHVGIFVCAHACTEGGECDAARTERAVFSNVRVTVPVREGYVAYREYIGSRMEILDVATGDATVVHRHTGSFQAPNWTTDGGALIHNQDGRLWRFDLATRTTREIPLGFADRNNNDHVLSFDGKTLAISHHSAADSGHSIVYTVPVEGGTPARVTAKGPSYLHGWSPDGRFLVYTGLRGGAYDVYRIPVAGGHEVRLTTAPGLDDGPEYSPDGRWIWFNSSRTGRMQIWRMRPDGRQQEQVTDDHFNNWFPHVSPDGRWIAYLSFPPPPEVRADDHPFYKRVTLRLMPADGSAPPRVIAYLYGGQGSINVPSWSPDSKRLAFVSNTGEGGLP